MPYGRYWHSVSFDLPTQNATSANNPVSTVAVMIVSQDCDFKMLFNVIDQFPHIEPGYEYNTVIAHEFLITL